MIPQAAITAWGRTRQWPTVEQIEQDLLLARTLVAIYNNSVLRDELAFRGGTCLHQVHLPVPLRYSEDLDFVRRTHSGIGEIFDVLREVAETVGLSVKTTEVGQFPKMKLQARAEVSGAPLRIKIEINTHETSPAADLVSLPFGVESSWFTGYCTITTFSAAELVATKLRALYERSKGRDLFDLWLALEQMSVAPKQILFCFVPYRPAGYTAAAAIDNLERKLASASFCNDLNQLVGAWPTGYDIDAAGALVVDQLLRHVDD